MSNQNPPKQEQGTKGNPPTDKVTPEQVKQLEKKLVDKKTNTETTNKKS